MQFVGLDPIRTPLGQPQLIAPAHSADIPPSVQALARGAGHRGRVTPPSALRAGRMPRQSDGAQSPSLPVKEAFCTWPWASLRQDQGAVAPGTLMVTPMPASPVRTSVTLSVLLGLPTVLATFAKHAFSATLVPLVALEWAGAVEPKPALAFCALVLLMSQPCVSVTCVQPDRSSRRRYLASMAWTEVVASRVTQAMTSDGVFMGLDLLRLGWMSGGLFFQ
ncbi:hypothetical protein BN874_130054 [Candidatus Contendobacter odensis Run_B_J11]|uniref:Uncharacterized protein n=1 Tax=Candidatus Contendobacter odensis Run_B_J11 TaxID=1400861 RepID=A0A7U7G8D1_9GAMM|nr:hypothetical protein BN874_130054 [Candidatus Contendobacter odensis Run_B_J11]